MNKDWRIIQAIVIFLILLDGYNNFSYYSSGDKFEILNLSLSSFWYLPPVILAVFVGILVISYSFLRKDIIKKILAFTIMIHSIYLITFSSLAYLPLFNNYWYLFFLTLFVSVIEFMVGKRMLSK
ncbi:hypothetical protein [Paenibacillus faecalis]|uniref:hypothetical protein n=1 Tax=Paenibacillus faecalis TaxID=2079532 RepID=UPI000D106FF8|nr:hypothetical protein [Paenibacillus faecalis]